MRDSILKVFYYAEICFELLSRINSQDQYSIINDVRFLCLNN